MKKFFSLFVLACGALSPVQAATGYGSAIREVGVVTESMLAFTTNNTTANATTSKHGLLRTLNGSAANFLDGQGNWSQISLSSSVTGNLPVDKLNGGTDANATNVWHGNGVWGPVNAGDLSDGLPFTASSISLFDGGIGADGSTFWNGTGTWTLVGEGSLSLQDNTTANTSTAAHGLAPKLSGDPDTYLDGDGNFTVPASFTSPGSVTGGGPGIGGTAIFRSSTTWIAPAGVTRVRARVWGPGGNGFTGNRGGGGGGYGEGVYTVVPGTSYTVTIPNAGSESATSFGAFLVANGGENADAGGSGAGGTSTGTYNVTGGSGVTSTQGGDAPLGGYGGTAANGSTGKFPGGGGYNGSAGAKGLVYLEFGTDDGPQTPMVLSKTFTVNFGALTQAGGVEEIYYTFDGVEANDVVVANFEHAHNYPGVIFSCNNEYPNQITLNARFLDIQGQTSVDPVTMTVRVLVFK